MTPSCEKNILDFILHLRYCSASKNDNNNNNINNDNKKCAWIFGKRFHSQNCHQMRIMQLASFNHYIQLSAFYRITELITPPHKLNFLNDDEIYLIDSGIKVERRKNLLLSDYIKHWNCTPQALGSLLVATGRTSSHKETTLWDRGLYQGRVQGVIVSGHDKV